MPIPLGVLVPLLLGGGFAAGELSDKLKADRAAKTRAKRMEQIPSMIAGIDAALQPQPAQSAPPEPAQGAMPAAQPTQVPQVAQPKQQGISEAALQPDEQPDAGPSPINLGEVSDLPMLPTRDLLAESGSIIKGYTITDEGKVNFQVGPNTSAIGAKQTEMFENSLKFFKRTRPNAPPLALDQLALSDMIRRSQTLPTTQLLQMLNPEWREKVTNEIFNASLHALASNPGTELMILRKARDEGYNLTPAALKAATTHFAIRSVASQMGNYMPDEAREILYKNEAPPLSAEVTQRVFQDTGVSNPVAISPTMSKDAAQKIKQERIAEHAVNAENVVMAQERAMAAIEKTEVETGQGPTARNAREQNILNYQRPLSDATAAGLGVPIGTTLKEVTAMGLVQATPEIIRDRKAVWGTLDLLDSMQNYAEEMITSDPNFISRMNQAWDMKLARFLGNDPIIKVYNDMRKAMLSVMSRNLGEKGTLTQQDIERAMKATSGDFASAAEMTEKFKFLKAFFKGKLANAEAAMLPKIGGQAPARPKVGVVKPTKPALVITAEGEIKEKE